MEELYEQIKERSERIGEVSKDPISADRFRWLKEEEKARVEKENFILSMMRANKSSQVISKRYPSDNQLASTTSTASRA
jgi:hypothetical protein